MSCRHSLRFSAVLLQAWLLLAAGEARGDAASVQKEATSKPVLGSTSFVLEPVRLSGRVHRIRMIYACRNDGAVAFSDRPCGEAMTLRSIALAPDAAGSAPDTVARPPSAATRPKPLKSEREPSNETTHVVEIARERCGTLQGQLDAVDARMRGGYSAREAAQLWNRWRDLKERLRDARC